MTRSGKLRTRLCASLYVMLTVLMPMLATAASSTDTLDAIVRNAHDAGQFDGVVLLGRDDDIVYRRAIGAADRVSQQAHAAGEVWRWAAITEQVTAVLVMQDVERGRLRLDGALAEQLPGFGGAAIGRITLRQLLMHTAGLANPDDTQADSRGVPAFYRSAAEAASVGTAPRFCAEAPKHAPGEDFEYNSCDYLVLAAVLERANAMSYAQLVAKRIAKPLKLRSLDLARSGSSAIRDGVVGYTSEGLREPAFDIGRYGGAGALYGTADDLLRFDRALIDFKLVSKATSATMWQGDPKFGYAAPGALAYAANLKHCAAPVAIVERESEIGGMRAVNVIAPDQHVALAAFSNTARTDWGHVAQRSGLLHDLLDAALCLADPPVVAPAKKRGTR